MPPPSPAGIAVAPATADWIDAAVRAGGATLVDPGEAGALVWTKADAPDALAAVLADNPQIGWVQLPWAGVEPYVRLMDDGRTWTCAKGVYADPVAEHALGLLLAGFRELNRYSAESAWTRPAGRNLIGARVTIVGGGGIAEALIELLQPFRCEITVVRRQPGEMAGTDRVLGPDRLVAAVAGADAVVLALALVPETEALFGADVFDAMSPDAWLINVARGAHVDTEALVAALESGSIGGAALDVTEPEPLPEGHPLWHAPNVIITPHTANTPEMAKPLLGGRITDNVRRYLADQMLVGLVDVQAGY